MKKTKYRSSKCLAILTICILLIPTLAACGKGDDATNKEQTPSATPSISDETTGGNASSGGNASFGGEDSSGGEDSVPTMDELAALPSASLPDSLPSRAASDFRIESDTGSGFLYDPSAGTCLISAAGTYDCYGNLYDGQLLIDAKDTDVIIVNLNGCTIYSLTGSPIYINSADSVEISAKKDTKNKISDYRTTENVSTNETSDVIVDSLSGSAAIYAKCDLTLKGTGSLDITSLANNGVHTKDDLKLQKLTLNLNAANNALKGNDSIEIKSGTICAIAKQGDGLKTSSTDLNKNGEQRGTIEISGGTVTIYASEDAIDAATDVILSEEAVVNLYTGTYAEAAISEGSKRFYLNLSNELYDLGYQYGAVLTSASGVRTFTDLSLYFAPSTSSEWPGGGGRPGGGQWGGFDWSEMTPPDGFTIPEGDTSFDGFPFPEGDTPSDDTTSTGDSSPSVVTAPVDGFDRSARQKQRPGEQGTDGGIRGGKTDRTDPFQGGGFFGGQSTGYAFSARIPDDCVSIELYAYSADQVVATSATPIAKSNVLSMEGDKDTITLSAITGQSITTSGWSKTTTNTSPSLAFSSKGMKAGNTIQILGGTATIYAYEDCLNAGFDTVLESTGKNGLGNIMISGGSLTLECLDDGIHADQDLNIDDGAINVLTSYEGLEANRVTLNGGNITIYATDDAVNANSKGSYQASIEITGGIIDASVPGGDTDTFDSNSTLVISGGTVLVKNGNSRGTMAGGALDAERMISITGGTVIAIGGISNSISNAAVNTSLSIPAGNYTLEGADGSMLYAFTTKSAYNGVLLYSNAGTTCSLINKDTGKTIATYGK